MNLILSLGLSAFVCSLVLTPVLRDAFRRIGVVDHPDGKRKLHVRPIPRVGGVAIALSYVASFGILLVPPLDSQLGIWQTLPEAILIFLAATIVFLTGLADDLKGLKPLHKIAGQLVAAVVAYAAGVQVHLDSASPLDPWISIPLTIIWLIGCTNAFNLIDGLDGLAAGVGLFATITVLLAGLMQNNLQLILVTVPLVGSLLGFLRYNFNPASVFLGDCGSMLIGFLLGCFGTMWSQKSATVLGMTAPLMALSIPLLDAGLAILRRFLRGQPIFRADRGHIHHRLLDRGWKPRRVALLLYGVAGIGACFSLLQSTLQGGFGGLMLVLFCLAAWIGIQNLGYLEFGMARKIIFKSTILRRIIDAQTRLQRLEHSLREAKTFEQRWSAIRDASRDFGFHSVRVKLGGISREDITSDSIAEAGRSWQLRISLPGDDYVNFTREMDTDLDQLVLGAFVKTVRDGLQSHQEANLAPLQCSLTEAPAMKTGAPRLAG
jgi:UDP-GlcNAc:undecaprenyl-phosphate GlcNAc-1-phosphate transferase